MLHFQMEEIREHPIGVQYFSQLETQPWTLGFSSATGSDESYVDLFLEFVEETIREAMEKKELLASMPLGYTIDIGHEDLELYAFLKGRADLRRLPTPDEWKQIQRLLPRRSGHLIQRRFGASPMESNTWNFCNWFAYPEHGPRQ